MVKVLPIAMMVLACGGGKRPPPPGTLDVTSTAGVTATFPAGSSRVTDPAHEHAVAAALVPGRTFTVTIDRYPAAAAPAFPGFAGYGRVAAEGISTFDETFDRNGITIRYIRQQGAAGDFNRFDALAVRGDRALVIRLAGPDAGLSAADTTALDGGFRAVLQSLR